MSLTSPDGKATLRVGYEHWWLEIEGHKITLSKGQPSISADDSSVTENAEVAWAPNSKGFFLTQSENRSGVQGFYTLVFRIVDGRVVSAFVNKIVQREFNRHHECVAYDARDKRYSEESDVGGLKWVDSDQLLMVAETTYDSQCDRGYFAGYLVSLAERRVIRRYSARELMRQWSDVVGDRLKNGFQRLTDVQKDAEP